MDPRIRELQAYAMWVYRVVSSAVPDPNRFPPIEDISEFLDDLQDGVLLGYLVEQLTGDHDSVVRTLSDEENLITLEVLEKLVTHAVVFPCSCCI